MKELVEPMLRSACTALAVIPLKDLEEHFEKCSKNLDMASSFGHFVDPTAWMKASTDGSFDDAEQQLEIVKHLLAARKAIEKRETSVTERRKCSPP